ncbi:extracellular solute-binding protein [Georgenia halophila]|uniref:Extracellular solute-binding protein n=1 Tax=Georgenia halophila TaxID=620889 RepID=A0ABP8KUW2_9MICO
MNHTSHPPAGVPARSAVNRRSFLGLMGLGVAAPGVLAACGSGGAPAGTSAAPGSAVSKDVLPTYAPITYAEPDFPSVNGSTAGYQSLPEELVRAFDSPPGSGGSYTAMTPLWGTIPPTSGNQYFEAVNKAIGSTIDFQISDGNTYGEKLAAVLASPDDVPDWVCIPTWNVPPRFDQAVANLFEDLTPYLSGDNAEKYPHLANIATDVWKFCVFEGKIKAIPYPGELITDAIFYRDDVLAAEGITPEVTDAEALRQLAKDLTGGDRWGANDMWTAATIIHRVPPEWTIDDSGKLLNRVETEEYRAALAWNASLYADGSIHPEAVADNSANAKTRFESGQVLITSDGVGAWHEALARQRGTNPDYSQRPFPAFAADGGEPLLFKGSPANIFSFLKKNEDKAKIEELLAVANFLASPFGTEEFQLINYGLEGVHYDKDDQGIPVPTDLAATEVQPSYIFLADPPVVNAKVQFPEYVEKFCTWMADAARYVTDPPFFGLQITEPPQFATLSLPFEDLEKDISRGRRSMADLDAAIETWRSSGGEELRAFYRDILESEG